jgi:fructose-1,6-bisphosphatase/inositol monophosphatase family enzyme
MPFETELAVARALAKDAGNLALRLRREGVASEDKPDASPVTEADRQAEQLLLEGLLRAFPGDGVLGEEGADVAPASGRRWIIDPIDGTRDFLRGNRLWANFIALEVDGAVELGVCNFPALDEQYYALRGGGAWRETGGVASRIHASGITDASRAVLCMSDFKRALRQPYGVRLPAFLERFWAVRSMGGAQDAMLVCSGCAELWIEPDAKPWDLAPIRIIAREAGLSYFDVSGQDTIYGGSGVVCVPALEPLAREFLGL